MVKRYDFVGHYGDFIEAADGEYVSFEDYDRLKKQLDTAPRKPYNDLYNIQGIIDEEIPK